MQLSYVLIALVHDQFYHSANRFMIVGSNFMHLNYIIRISPSNKWIRECDHYDNDNIQKQLQGKVTEPIQMCNTGNNFVVKNFLLLAVLMKTKNDELIVS